MTSDLKDLYQEVILDHNRKPRNFRRLEGATHRAEGYNPLCGDKITVYIRMDGDIVKEAAFDGSGCAISKASASMMTESVAGMSRGQVSALFEAFHRMVTGREAEPSGPAAAAVAAAPDPGKLVVFSGVREFPMRVKCATLAWHTLRAALLGRDAGPVSTE